MKKKRFIKIINKLKSGRLLDQDEFKDSIDLIKKFNAKGHHEESAQKGD
jgi:hypothetical protein